MSLQRIPQELIDLSESIGKSQSSDDRAASQLTDLFACMCDIVASTRETAQPDIPQIIADATRIDVELSFWAANVPEELEIETQAAPITARAYSDTCERYSSIFSAEVWIIYRTARFGVNSLLTQLYATILEVQPCQDYSPESQRQVQPEARQSCVAKQMSQCASLCESLEEDMCSGVPFLLGLNAGGPESLNNLPLSTRTLPMNLLVFLTRTQSTSERMCRWAEDLLVELRAQEGVDNGAIWMNNPLNEGNERLRP